MMISSIHITWTRVNWVAMLKTLTVLRTRISVPTFCRIDIILALEKIHCSNLKWTTQLTILTSFWERELVLILVTNLNLWLLCSKKKMPNVRTKSSNTSLVILIILWCHRHRKLSIGPTSTLISGLPIDHSMKSRISLSKTVTSVLIWDLTWLRRRSKLRPLTRCRNYSISLDTCTWDTYWLLTQLMVSLKESLPDKTCLLIWVYDLS